jgi:hypothetical protein
MKLPSDNIIDFYGIIFRQADNNIEDCNLFCDLFNSHYSRRVDELYYKWQYFETPFPSNLFLAITRTGELAGCYGYQIKDTCFKQNIAWAIDIIIDYPFQQKGLFRHLAGFAANKVNVFKPIALCVMANLRANFAHVKGLHWRQISIFENYIRVTSDLSLLEHKSFQFIPAQKIKNEFWNKEIIRKSPSIICNKRSNDYLKWRFLDSPWYKYEYFYVVRNAKEFGYIILKIFRDPQSRISFGDIVDMMWIEDDPIAIDQMVKFAITYFYRKGIHHATIWLQGNSILEDVGVKLGFSETDQKRYFSCKVINNCYEWLKDHRRWFITMADSEIY